MRKAALRLITLAVFGYPIVVTDIDGEKTVVMLIDDSRDSVRVNPEVRSRSIETKSPTLVATEDPNVFETEIDGEKRVIVMLSD